MGDKILVGNFQMGLHNIRLYADPEGTGGHVDLRPLDQGPAKIVVGINDEAWPNVYSTLLHEVYELALIDQSTRYAHRPAFSDESSNYIFIVTHNQLDEAHTRVAWFLVKSMKDFKKAYDKFWKEKRAVERKKKKK